MPPMPIERISDSDNGNATIASSPSATVEPDRITERPAWVIVSTTADSISSSTVSTGLPRYLTVAHRCERCCARLATE
ncbi:MAG: hypothetical protein QOK16_120 [Solirubrobacteraceae bacterium]|jgi:hypothetical protein|nr:hypothetical protein [Solirubrobacteraceae bacterium]